MAPRQDSSNSKKVMARGAWTLEEDNKLALGIEIHGAKKWKIIAAKSGLNRCGKSCRLRWLNYLRPNIKRGNISDDEEDLIIRLHKLLGNRWSLIAGRLPGRTDNEIKNYWNSHLGKKANQKEKKVELLFQEKDTTLGTHPQTTIPNSTPENLEAIKGSTNNAELGFDTNEFFDFSVQGLDWINKLLALDEDPVQRRKK